MPRKRQPPEIWAQTRQRILARDGWRCARCGRVVHDGPPHNGLSAHVDHVKSGKAASNADSNLRVLCRLDHVTRLDGRHRGMIAKALAEGILPPDWRPLLWSDDD